MEHKFKLLCLILLTLWMLQKYEWAGKEPTPVLFKEVHAIPYTTSIPLMFEVTLPEWSFDWLLEWSGMENSPHSPTGLMETRQSRLNGAGFVTRPLHSRLFEGLLGEAAEAEQLIRELRTKFCDSQMLRVEQIDYSKAMAVPADPEQRDLVEALERAAERNALRKTLNSCLRRSLPTRLVTERHLSSALRRLQPALNNNSYKLATQKVEAYLNESIAECFITRNKVFVVVNIPVLETGRNWELMRFTFPEFKYNGAQCKVHPYNAANHLATANGELKIIRRDCDLERSNFCLVAYYEHNASPDSKCVKEARKSPTVQEISKYCRIECKF